MTMQNGFNGTRQIVDVAINTGSTALLATGPVRHVKITESALTSAGAPNTLQGFEYQLISIDLATGVKTLGPWIPAGTPTADAGDADLSTVELGDPMSVYGPHGSILGNGPSNIIGLPPTPATVLCNLRSLTGTATSLVVVQDY